MPSSSYIMLPIFPRECFRNIIEFVKEESISHLYSCILVNRQWMNECLPLLWNRPFTPTSPNGVRLINTYISCLNFSQKQYLIDNGIDLRQNSTPGINYLKFLRELDYEIFEAYARSWLLENNYSEQASSTEDLNLIIESLDTADIEDNNDQLKVLLSCLFSMIIEKSINITYIRFDSDNELCSDLPELPTRISPVSTYSITNSFSSSHVSLPTRTFNYDSLRKLMTFKCKIKGSDLYLPNLMKFMEIISIRCKMLTSIFFTWKNQYDRTIFNYLIEIIEQQRQLNIISLNANNIGINSVIVALVNTQRNSLVNIKLKSENFRLSSNIVINFFRLFHKLKVLKLINSREKLIAIRNYEMITEIREYRNIDIP